MSTSGAQKLTLYRACRQHHDVLKTPSLRSQNRGAAFFSRTFKSDELLSTLKAWIANCPPKGVQKCPKPCTCQRFGGLVSYDIEILLTGAWFWTLLDTFGGPIGDPSLQNCQQYITFEDLGKKGSTSILTAQAQCFHDVQILLAGAVKCQLLGPQS